MGEITSDAAIMAALGRQMTRAVQKQAVAAGNLANLDTPGYRTKEAEFSDALDAQRARMEVAVSNLANAESTRSADGRPYRRREVVDADADGFVSVPNVDVPEEMVDMLGAARAYQANLTAICLIRDTLQRALELAK